MTTIQGVDYSFARPGGAALKAAGKDFAVRYVPYPGDGGKGLTASEVIDLHANGIAIGLVFESTAGRALEGRDAGIADAQMCQTTVPSLGFPVDRPIYFAIDFDAQPNQSVAIDAYLDGAAQVLGWSRIGVYGSYAVVTNCRATFLWQTYAWSGGKKADGIHLYQYLNGQEINGSAVDFTEGYGDDFGQWPAPEGDAMERFRLGLLAVAGGEYVRMSECYDALAAAGFRPPLPALPGDGGLGDLNGVEMRRWGIVELAASDAAQAAYQAIGG